MQFAAINGGAAVLKAHIFHSAEVWGKSGSPLSFVISFSTVTGALLQANSPKTKKINNKKFFHIKLVYIIYNLHNWILWNAMMVPLFFE